MFYIVLISCRYKPRSGQSDAVAIASKVCLLQVIMSVYLVRKNISQSPQIRPILPKFNCLQMNMFFQYKIHRFSNIAGFL